MKRFFVLTVIVLVFQITGGAGCKEKKTYWLPEGRFPLIQKDGSLSENSYFALSEVEPGIDVLVINFFAPKCKPCIEEVPELKLIAENIEQRPGVKFIAIGSTLGTIGDDNFALAKVGEEVRQFLDEFSISYESYAANAELLESYGVRGFPETFILAKNKKNQWFVKRRYISVVTEKNIYDYLPAHP